MKLRFSLRVLLLAVAALAALGYWRTRPQYVAERFVAALQAGDYRRANSLLSRSGPNEPFVIGDAGAEFWAERQPQSFRDWIRGECRVAFIGKGTAFGFDGIAVATAPGVASIRLNSNANFAPTAPWADRLP